MRRAAVAIGYHPSLVWGLDWWDEARHPAEPADWGGDEPVDVDEPPVVAPPGRSSAELPSMRRHPSARAVRRALRPSGGYVPGDAA